MQRSLCRELLSDVTLQRTVPIDDGAVRGCGKVGFGTKTIESVVVKHTR